jgi:hypothetical protein
MMMKLNPAGILIGGLAATWITVLLALTPASAQPTDAQRSAIRSACRSDYMANCSSVTPGGMEALQCLQRNEAKLSGACRSAVNAISTKPETQAAPEAPKPAAAPAAAPAVAPAKPAVPAKPATAAAPPSGPPAPTQGAAPAKRTTTGAKPAAAAPATAAAPAAVIGPPPAPPPLPLAQIPPRFELQVVRSCRAEARTICALPAGGGRILNCLAANQLQVSPACSLALDRARAAAR